MANYPITVLCRCLCVSTSGFYDWARRRHHPSARSVRDARARIHAELALGDGIRVGRKRVARLMRLAGIQGVYLRGRKGCTRRDPAATPADDLVQRRFEVEGPSTTPTRARSTSPSSSTPGAGG